MDSGQLRQQQSQEGLEQPFATNPGVVRKLEKAQVQRQLLLGDAVMGAPPGAPQRPEPLAGVEVDLVNAIAVFIARGLAVAVADRAVQLAPVGPAVVEGIVVGVDRGTGRDQGAPPGADRDLLDVRQQADDHRPAAWAHPHEGRLLTSQRATPAGALEPAPPSLTAFDCLGVTFMPGHDVPLVAFDHARPARLGLTRHDPGASRRGHRWHGGLVQP